MLKASTGQREEESKKPEEGVDIDFLDVVVKEVGAGSWTESGTKFNVALFELINGTCEETEAMHYEVISGGALDGELIKEATKAEMGTLKKRGCCEKTPVQECWENKGPGWSKTGGRKQGRRGKPGAPTQVSG